MLKKRTKKLFEILFYPLISILVFLIIWDIGVRNSELSVVMPGPWEVIIQFLQSFISPIGRYTMPYHMLYSLMRVIPAYIGGSVLGIDRHPVAGRFGQPDISRNNRLVNILMQVVFYILYHL